MRPPGCASVPTTVGTTESRDRWSSPMCRDPPRTHRFSRPADRRDSERNHRDDHRPTDGSGEPSAGGAGRTRTPYATDRDSGAGRQRRAASARGAPRRHPAARAGEPRMSAATPTTDAGARTATRGTPGAGVFVVTAVGGLLVSLDVSVANALLPAIGRDFAGDGRAALSWVITGYAIVFAAALVPAGRVADRAGRRRTYLAGLGIFAGGSLLCGIAPDLDVLLAGRTLQGLGAAAASPASLGLLLAAWEDRHRAQYAARWTGAAAVGVCLGPLVGGAVTTAVDWRWAFLVNLPVVAAVAVAAPRLLPESPRHPGRPLPDPVGAVVFAVAAAALTLVLSETTTWGVVSARTLARS